MFRNYTCLSFIGAVALTACSVVPERSPIYIQTQAPSSAQPLSASYQTTQARAAEQDCRRTETNRELIGGAVGGAAGAYAGKKLIGGTKGVVAGAALGGVVGYGIGDISTNCSSASTPSYSNAGYQSTPANFAPISCPIGTKPHSSGSCLLDDPNASLTSETFTGVPTRTIHRVQVPTRSQNVVRASTTAPIATPTAPSAYRGVDVTRQSGANYGGNYRVVSGDTVYSLSRKLCVPVSTIQTSNGLNSNYGIQIGQSLNLPASLC